MKEFENSKFGSASFILFICEQLMLVKLNNHQ